MGKKEPDSKLHIHVNSELGITITAQYLGIIRGFHVWETQILEVEAHPVKFYRTLGHPHNTVTRVVYDIALHHKHSLEELALHELLRKASPRGFLRPRQSA